MRLGRIILTAPLAAGAFAGPATTASAAHAETVNISCQRATHTSYSPGLTTELKTIKIEIKGTLSDCKGTDPKITGGTFIGHGAGPLSCARGGYPIKGEITWNTGEKSVFAHAVIRSTLPDGQITSTVIGTILSGKFTGDKSSANSVVAKSLPAACSTPKGVTSLDGVVRHVISRT